MTAGLGAHAVLPPHELKAFLSAFGPADESGQQGLEQQLAEVVVTQSSPLQGVRMSELGRVTWGKLAAIGIHQARESRSGAEDDDPKLDTGDVLLVQGARTDIDELSNDTTLLVLDRIATGEEDTGEHLRAPEP